MAKAAFNRKKYLLTGKLDLNVRNKLVKFCSWSIALYSAEIGHFEKCIRNTWKVLKRGSGEGWIRSVGQIV
jgi:hypothetical protein